MSTVSRISYVIFRPWLVVSLHSGALPTSQVFGFNGFLQGNFQIVSKEIQKETPRLLKRFQKMSQLS